MNEFRQLRSNTRRDFHQEEHTSTTKTYAKDGRQRSTHSKIERRLPRSQKSCNIAVTFGMNSSRKQHIDCFSDTGVRTSLLRENLVQYDWRPSIRVCNSPRLKRVTNQSAEVIGTVVLHDQRKESSICVMLRIVRNWAVPFSFVHCLQKKFIMGIFLTKRTCSHLTLNQ